MNYFCSTPKTQSLQKLLNDNFFGKHIPVDGMIELTHKCNFHCIHCYAKNERSIKDMSYKQIVEILYQLHEAGCLSLAFTGGEVLCRKDFIDIYLKAKELGFIIIILSNASLITESIAKVFYDYPLCYFSTTMYGFDEKTYEIVTGNKNNYKLFMNGLELLSKYKIPIELKTIALRENYYDIKDIYNFAKKRKYIFRCSVSIRDTNDGNDDPLNHAITPEQMLKLDTEIIKERTEFWKNAALSESKISSREKKCLSKCKYLCNAGMNNFVIDASGNLHICAAERRYGISLFEHSFKECWSELLPYVYNQKIEDHFACHTCKYIDYCEQCSAQIDFVDGKVIIPSYKCELAKLRYEWCKNIRDDKIVQ